MPKRAALGVTICVISSLLSSSALAQDRKSTDAAIDAMRENSSISRNDKQRIRDWIERAIDELAATPEGKQALEGTAFCHMCKSQSRHPRNDPAFRTEFLTQVASVAAAQFADPDVDPNVAASLARILLDENATEAIPGLIAGLACKVDAARYLSARGIIGQQAAIAADSEQFSKVIKALQTAGVSETSSIVSSRIYRALAFPGQATDVLDAYLAIFDKRLTKRRTSNISDGAETEAFFYFSETETLGSLNQEQKTKLVTRVAVFFRLDAERFNNELLDFVEIDNVERSLVQAELLLKTATNASDGGNITKLLEKQGRSGMDLVPLEAAKWVGNAETKSQGPLNAAPWNVPVGAP